MPAYSALATAFRTIAGRRGRMRSAQNSAMLRSERRRQGARFRERLGNQQLLLDEQRFRDHGPGAAGDRPAGRRSSAEGETGQPAHPRNEPSQNSLAGSGCMLSRAARPSSGGLHPLKRGGEWAPNAPTYPASNATIPRWWHRYPAEAVWYPTALLPGGRFPEDSDRYPGRAPARQLPASTGENPATGISTEFQAEVPRLLICASADTRHPGIGQRHEATRVKSRHSCRALGTRIG